MEINMTTCIVDKLTLMLDEDSKKDSSNSVAKQKICSILAEALSDPELRIKHYRGSHIDYHEYPTHNFKFKETTAFLDAENQKFVFLAVKGKNKRILVFNIVVDEVSYTIMPYMASVLPVRDRFEVEVLKIHKKIIPSRSAKSVLTKSITALISILSHENTTKH